ncbi:TonB-dependent receptor [Flagellimonas pacifica]|nr:TonB-dependent receptor [Allomuricauda parva]
MKKLYSLIVALFVSTIMFSQGTVTGTVMDGDMGTPLPGASVVLQGTQNGTSTDFDGKFTIEVSEDSGTLVVSYIGFVERRISFSTYGDIGSITLNPDAEELEGVVVVGTGVIDLAKERETPVAVSTITAKEIQLKVGNTEFPEILNTTPSVYATKQGGGYGDSRINLRGFNQNNTAVIINGQPVNDMENGWVYWSNWQGLSDIASGMQVQRGLGSSKLAVPSVGGTLTIVTKSTEKEEGGFAKISAGNDSYFKTVVGYNTGTNEKGWSSSILLGRWSGDGYVDATEGEGYTYLFSLGYMPSDKHAFNFTFTGAAQWHNQRDFELSIRDHLNYGGDDFRKFNGDWGMLNGETYTFRRNFYNKPIGTLNWDWNIDDKLSLSTSIYGSWGRGGGTGPRGRNFSINPFRKDLTEGITDGLTYRNADGTIDFDAVVANNRAGDAYTVEGPYEGAILGSNGFSDNGVNSNIAIRRASMNSHNWYGAISNLKWELNDEWTLGGGVDLRSYKGFHYRVLNDLLGLDGYVSTGNENITEGLIIRETIKASPFNNTGLTDNKIDYYNVGKVNWFGFNGITEYNNRNNLSAVLQIGVSNQTYQRIDYFNQPNEDAESDKDSKVGGYIKGGANYNIDDSHNVFFNAGYIERQPLFDAIFPNFANAINEDAENEQITSFELGYGYRSSFLNANINLYNTTWDNRFISESIRGVQGLDNGTANFAGVKQVHSGLELDFNMRPVDRLRLDGMMSIGNWQFKDNVTASVFDGDQNLVDTATLYVDGTKVGDAAQFTASLEADYEIIENLGVDVTWRHAANLYSDFTFQLDTRNWANDAQFLAPNNRGALKLPSYNLFDLGLDYQFDFEKSNIFIRLNVNNIFDTEYISEASSSIYVGDEGPASDAPVSTYKGIDDRNLVWFGFGRTWNLSLSYNF